MITPHPSPPRIPRGGNDWGACMSPHEGRCVFFFRPRATVASQDLTVAPLEQTAAYSGEQIPWILDIYTWAYACSPSFMYVD